MERDRWHGCVAEEWLARNPLNKQLARSSSISAYLSFFAYTPVNDDCEHKFTACLLCFWNERAIIAAIQHRLDILPLF